ncbi:SFH3 [Scenedesmus sp. PABB004]|nr:SFH3 [Scenedesmus sp. PABB004]
MMRRPTPPAAAARAPQPALPRARRPSARRDPLQDSARAGMAPPAAPPQSPSALGRRFSSRGPAVRKTHLDLDQEHAHALAELKARLAARAVALPHALIVAGDVDATLFRFLRARKYSVDAAAAMLEKSLAWRAQVGADAALEQPLDARLVSLVRACRPSSYIGHDRERRPVFVERLGKLDGKRMEREGVSDDVLLAYHLREMEFMAQVVLPEASAVAGHTVDRIVSIMDAQGLTLTALTGFAQRLFRLITAMDSDNYPECAEAIYIANAGATFTAIWRLVAPFVDKGTRDKVHVLSGGKAMQQALLTEFGRELVPTFLGGALDYDAVRQSWLDKMDADSAALAAHPRSTQPPIVLQAPAATANGHGHGASSGGGGAHLQAPHGRHSGSGSWQWLRVSSDRLRRASAASSDADGWATPMSAASRLSATSGASVYFDAAYAPDPPSPSGGSPSSAHSGGRGGGSPFRATPPHSGGGGGGGGGGDGGAGSTCGSMSVGPPASRSALSQGSGFTGLGGGAHGGGGPGSVAHSLDDALVHEEGEGPQPRCRCVPPHDTARAAHTPPRGMLASSVSRSGALASPYRRSANVKAPRKRVALLNLSKRRAESACCALGSTGGGDGPVGPSGPAFRRWGGDEGGAGGEGWALPLPALLTGLALASGLAAGPAAALATEAGSSWADGLADEAGLGEAGAGAVPCSPAFSPEEVELVCPRQWRVRECIYVH